MRELFDALCRHAAFKGGAVAVADDTARLGYAALARRTAAIAQALGRDAADEAVVGILAGDGIDAVLAQLAGWHAGKTVVTLPSFFSMAQLAHIVRDAGIGHLLTTAKTADASQCLGLPMTVVAEQEVECGPAAGSGAAVITYTSGSTGQPKGVLLQGAQVMATACGLIAVMRAHDDDRYLSVLPLALLLETVCAIVIPIVVGADVRLAPSVAAGLGEASGEALAHLAATHRPSCMMLVPQLLRRWTAYLTKTERRAPDSLRFVAVGGAPVAPGLAARAWLSGIPVYEGYGLSECGSVVSLNSPDARRAGTVGRPLPGVTVAIEKGEIVVAGRSVMSHYIDGGPTRGVWHTGDLGELDADGYLRVHGRRDNLLITSAGRNISPEWIEAALSADERIAHCVVTLAEDGCLMAVLIPTTTDAEPLRRASAGELQALVAACCREAPDYARPRRVVVLAESDTQFGFVTSNGRVRRAAVLQALAATAGPPADADRSEAR